MMAKVLLVMYGEEGSLGEVFNGPVGKFTFAEDEFGGFTCTSVAPYDPNSPTAPPVVANRSAAGGGLAKALSPGLKALSEGLAQKSRDSAERARAAAAEQEAAKQAATPSRLPDPVPEPLPEPSVEPPVEPGPSIQPEPPQ